MTAAQRLFGEKVYGTLVPEDEGDFLTQLARDVLNGTRLTDLQTLFADEMQVSNSPLSCPTEASPLLIPANPKTWLEWALEHQATEATIGRRLTSKQNNISHTGQMSIWSDLKEE